MTTHDHSSKQTQDVSQSNVSKEEHVSDNSSSLDKLGLMGMNSQNPNSKMMTQRDILQLQRTIGNQATYKLIQNHAHQQVNTSISSFFVSKPKSIQRFPTYDDFQKRIDNSEALDELATSLGLKEEESPKQYDGIFGSIEQIIDEIFDSIAQSAFEDIKNKLNIFHEYDKKFKELNPAYTDHTERLAKIRGVRESCELYLTVKEGNDPISRNVKWLLAEANKLFVEASPNAERAKQAQIELKVKQSADTTSPPRISDELIDILVLSIASPINETDQKGQAGIIGIQTAVDAAETLTLVNDEDYQKLMGLLKSSGDNLGDVAKQGTLLKAMAARKADLIAAGPQNGDAMEKMNAFAESIRDMDRDEMLEATHVADRGSGQGLQQRFTMSCGPTSIQIVKGEFDPIYALKITQEGEHGLDSSGNIASEQRQMLEGNNGADTAVPREVEDAYPKFKKAFDKFRTTVENDYDTRMFAPEISDEDFDTLYDEWQAKDDELADVINYIQGSASDATKRAAGIVQLEAGGIDANHIAMINQFKKYYSLFDNPPGLNNSEFAGIAKSKLKDSTGRNFDETFIQYKKKLISGKKQLRGKIRQHFTQLDKALFRGKSVPMGVMWLGGGGHFMVFTDIRSEEKNNKTIKYYLISDPWEGNSGWMSRRDLIRGLFGKIGASQGAIDSIYL